MANITGPDIAMDHHRFYPYGTLWSNINLGAGDQPAGRQGAGDWPAGSRLTFTPALPLSPSCM